MKKIFGTKQEMTQIFADDGSLVPVTIVDIAGNMYLGSKTLERDGYVASIIGIGSKRNATASEKGKYKKLPVVPEYIVENRDEVVDGIELGPIKLDDLSNKSVTVTGLTKGKGFQGGMKRWGFSGGKRTHGQSDRMRAPGSIGSGTTPGRVYKGKKMAGRTGGVRKTVKNLKVVKHLTSENILLLKGAVPGNKGSKIIISVLD